MAEIGDVVIPEHVARERVFHFDIYEDPGIRRELHASYARLHREAPPVFYTPANGGHWIVTGYDVMREIVKDHEHFSARESVIPRMENPPFFIPLNLDPPEHTRYRVILASYFSPKSVRGMEGDFQSFASELVATVAGQGECEFVRDISARFPVTIFLNMMGAPTERFDEFREIAEGFFANAGSEAAQQASAQRIIGTMVELIEARRRNRRPDEKPNLISTLLDAKVQGEPLPMDKLVSMAFLMFLGGLDTVTNALSFSIRHLATRPDQQQRLREDPAAIDPYVDESLRMFGVVNTPRIVIKDCEKFGVRFRAGEMLLNCLPAAGWDPAKHDRPATFDIDRPNREHLTFSDGPHLCIGAFLARAEMRVLVSEWIRQVGAFRLAEGYTPSYRAGMVMALDSLPLLWEPMR